MSACATTNPFVRGQRVLPEVLFCDRLTLGVTAVAGGARRGRTDPAFWIEVSAEADGTFRVTNARNNFTKSYAARR